jgi:hypothetical protein
MMLRRVTKSGLWPDCRDWRGFAMIAAIVPAAVLRNIAQIPQAAGSAASVHHEMMSQQLTAAPVQGSRLRR